MKKELRILLIIGIVALLVGLVYLVSYDDEDEQIVGGERDEHGCLGAAGYTWNESELACVREWVSGEGRLQVVNFRTCADAGYPVMESYPRQCRAPNGDLFVEGISPTECLDIGGRNVNIVAGAGCYDNETNFSPVVGFISPNICCVPV